MELITNDAAWFLSSSGKQAFDECKNLEERSVFLYSYLLRITEKNLRRTSQNNIKTFLFKMAFLLSNSISTSNTEYSSYPALIDANKNPFIAYISKVQEADNTEGVYCILLSILHGIANPYDNDSWIYDEHLFDNDPSLGDAKYKVKTEELGKKFIENLGGEIINTTAYDIDESLREIQAEIAYLFILQNWRERKDVK